MGMTTFEIYVNILNKEVVEACRLDGYDNFDLVAEQRECDVVEACRLDGYDNFVALGLSLASERCRSLSFGWV